MADNRFELLPDEDSERAARSTQRFAKLLESLEAKGISQQAAALRVKVPPQYLSDVKAGRRALTELFARRLENEFHVDYNWLLGRSGSMKIPAFVAGPESDRLWLPAFNHPVRGEPQRAAAWDGACVELAGVAAVKARLADQPYVLRFGADDRRNRLGKNDLLLISQALDDAAEFQVLQQGAKRFLARRVGSQWEPVSTSAKMTDQNVTRVGHCLGIVWRML